MSIIGRTDDWVCPKCRSFNSGRLSVCGGCGTPVPKPTGQIDHDKDQVITKKSGEKD